DAGGLLLVLIIFAWTPPHFWALALDRKDEYAKAGVPMLPVTHGESFTRLHILLYTFILVLASVMPFVIGMSGWLYFVGALALGAGFLYWSFELLANRSRRAPMQTFRYSIVYLGLLFTLLLVDHYMFVPTGGLAPVIEFRSVSV
ncbi:MAG: UbiA family prenyltransferase, partial [Gammaproteobacteria bacterium]|nr:UbiA family prenyltransferase [Gammaproteobacteria bacterium]